MPAVKVKICGITRLEDALSAASAGADLLGFIFYKGSPRYVDPQNVKNIASTVKALPNPPLLVGVFVNEEAAAAAEVLDLCGLDLAQLSGEEPPEIVSDPSSPLYGRSYKTVRPATLDEAERELDSYLPSGNQLDRPLLLVDAYHKHLRGGTGQKADWRVAAYLARRLPGVMLAGGLNPSNVAEAIAHVHPYAVDVSSGVEESPGIKDPGKMMEFITAARNN